MAEVALPFGDSFHGVNLPTGYEPALSKPLDFGSGTTATAVFPVNDHGFGVEFNGVNAYAALPEVSYHQTGIPGFAPPIFWAQYPIPSPASYDWSPFPPVRYSLSGPTWQEFLTRTTGDTAGRVAFGINHTRQASDATWTFIAGALLGLGGGAVLSAVQELLHAMQIPAETGQ